jgi:hypothetical protein
VNRTIKWLEQTHEYVQKDFDRMIPVVADEGMGKSTLMLELGWLWLDIIEKEQTVDNVMDQIAWDLPEFQEMMGSKPEKSCIMVHDAARVMSRKKAMHGDQIEVEEDLLDARFGNYLVLLGYQDFDVIPTMLATRRSKNLLRITTRGRVHGHNEANIRKRYETGDWPEPTMTDTFPDLEGKKLWERFEAEDQRRKQERIQPDEDDSEEELTIKELAQKVKEDGLHNVVSLHGGHNRYYIDSDLVEIEYGVSGQKAKKATKLLKRDEDVDPTQVA